MSNYSGYNYFSQRDVGGQQLTIMSELFKAVGAMQHIDELLQWLASRIVQHFGIQATEIWSMQGTSMGHFSMQLRTLVRQDATLPEHIVANQHAAGLAGLLAQQRAGFHLQSAATVFPSYQASLLRRYGLNYCSGHFFSNTALLIPPLRHGASPGSIPTPLVLAMLFFLRQSLSQQTIAAAGLILEQAMTVASDHGLLTSVRASQVSGGVPAPSPVPESVSLPLTALIPRRYADAALMQSSNPLARSVDIADRSARRLYAAINGSRDVSELSDVTELELKEIARTLKILLDERRIELYAPGGQRVDPAQYFS